jgi:hypothetical protein
VGQHQIRAINTKKGEDMNWVWMELRKLRNTRTRLRKRMMVNMRKVRTIEKIVGECEPDIYCRIEPQVVIVEDKITPEEVGNNKNRCLAEE